MRVIQSEVTNPFWNLALEECIFEQTQAREGDFFRNLGAEAEILFLWRNESSVIIGRNQNPWRECHVDALERDGVHLVRRGSGGGAVFQDVGNSIFSFFSPKDGYSRDGNFAVLIAACAQLGFQGDLAVTIKGRNDLEVQGRKVSGSAFKLNNRRALHHGTLLLDTDMSRLSSYLHPNKLKLKSKGVASAQARVVNMKQALIDAGRRDLAAALTHENLCTHIAQQFLLHHQSHDNQQQQQPAERWGEAEFVRFPAFQEKLGRLMDWSWRFGECPSFEHQLEHRFEWGTVDVNINSENGLISEIQVYSDSLYPQMIDLIEAALKGVPYQRQAMHEALQRWTSASQHEAFYPLVQEFSQWIVSKL